jgi:hypothetical protein
LSVDRLKLKTPTEIALQDSIEDFSPSVSPSPPHRQSIQKSKPVDPTFRPSVPLPSSHSTMDWTPSPVENTFSPRSVKYSPESSAFASGKGLLPPSPGTTFRPAHVQMRSRPLTKPDHSSDDEELSKPFLNPRTKDIQLREQRLFPPQV